MEDGKKEEEQKSKKKIILKRWRSKNIQRKKGNECRQKNNEEQRRNRFLELLFLPVREYHYISEGLFQAEISEHLQQKILLEETDNMKEIYQCLRKGIQ